MGRSVVACRDVRRCLPLSHVMYVPMGLAKKKAVRVAWPVWGLDDKFVSAKRLRMATDASGPPWVQAVRGRCHRWLHFTILSLSLLGSQVVWSLELAYGTPYLLSLGLSKSATGYVWMAGPLSGLIMQPVLGSLSDSSMSPFRRRKYMIGSSAVVALSTCLIAFSEPLSLLVLDVIGIGLGDWDPARRKHARHVMQVLSILGFWIFDFGVNGLQVTSRALILDHVGVAEQNEANAWHGRMLHAGNMIGYWCGWVDLASWPSLAWIGGGQFRRFAVVSIACMCVCVAITCMFTPEHCTRIGAKQPSEGMVKRLHASIRQVWSVGRALPLSIQRVCLVELLASMSWFPFLFYSTTYVLDMSHKKHKHHSDADRQIGSLAMLCFAILAMISGLILPSISLAGRTNASSVAEPEPWRTRSLSLRTIWTLGALFQAILMVGTFFVRKQAHAIVLVMLMGIPWSVWMWVPYAMIGEFVREAEKSTAFSLYDEQWPAQRIMEHQKRASLQESEQHAYPRRWPSTFDSSLRSSSIRSVSGTHGPSIVSRGPEVVRPDDGNMLEDSTNGGTVLGIHNLSIVLPQLLMALIAALVFRWTKGGNGDVAWVLRLSGFVALGAACLTRFVPLTLTERKARHAGYTLLPDDDEAGAAEVEDRMDDSTNGSLDADPNDESME